MKTTLNIPDVLITEAMQSTGMRTKTETIRLALEELIQRKRTEKIMASAGTLTFSADWDNARHGR